MRRLGECRVAASGDVESHPSRRTANLGTDPILRPRKSRETSLINKRVGVDRETLELLLQETREHIQAEKASNLSSDPILKPRKTCGASLAGDRA